MSPNVRSQTPSSTLLHGLAACAAAAALLGVSSSAAERPLEGRVPTRTKLRPSVEAAFPRESYAPRSIAKLVIYNRARGLRLRIFRSGPERVVSRTSTTMNGAPVSGTRSIGASRHRRVVVVHIGDWPSGLYFARLVASDGRIGFAPFVVRPRRLGEHRVAVVLPTLTWQAYNVRDDDGDGLGGSWYASWTTNTVRLGRPHLSRGVPFKFNRYDLPFLRWLSRTGKQVDILAQSDLETARSAPALARAYELIVFPGHHEYVTAREYDLVERYRDLGGNLMFLSANNFFWQVVRRGSTIERTQLWRELGRPEGSLIGVQYTANKPQFGRYVVTNTSAESWVFAGTDLHRGSRFGWGGIEIDGIGPSSPRNVRLVARIPNVFGPGRHADMTIYRTRKGGMVFAAGAFTLAGSANWSDVSTILENLWARLAGD